MKNKLALPMIVAICAVALFVLVLSYWPFKPSDMPMNTVATVEDQSNPQPLYWVAPMDADYRRDGPGLSPMGMSLIAVFEAGDTIKVSSSIQQNLGIRTAVVLEQDLSSRIRAVGYTHWDESSIQMLHTRAEGWVEEFYPASIGDRVREGDPIYELFAPNLVSVQREYLTASQSNNVSLLSIAADRLRALGFTQHQVEELDRSREVNNRLVVRAERDAIVTYIGVRKGNYVEAHNTIVTLASLEKVWVETEVFESMAAWIEPGLSVRISFPAFPGESWSSEIAYVYPELDPTTRSLRLRLVVENEEQRLKPNMFANVEIDAIPKLNVLTVPREAVIRAGQGDRVILSLGNGRFKPQVVQLGVVSGPRVEILAGLAQGDVVVTSGQFLLDSEANGEQAFARLTSTADADAAASSSMPMTAGTDVNTVEIYSAVGDITQIVIGETMTLSHQAVAALAWPAMVMAFQIPEELDLAEFKVGDSVAFEFTATAQGEYQLSSVRPRGEAQ